MKEPWRETWVTHLVRGAEEAAGKRIPEELFARFMLRMRRYPWQSWEEVPTPIKKVFLETLTQAGASISQIYSLCEEAELEIRELERANKKRRKPKK